VPERAEHRVEEGAFVPGPVVAPPIDEERGCVERPARAGARQVGIDPLPGVLRFRRGGRAPGIDAELARNRGEIIFRQHFRARHQQHVRPPEILRPAGPLDEFGRAAREVVAGEWPLAKDVSQPVAELAAHLRDAFVGRAAVRAGVAAVLEQRDWRAVRAEGVVGAADRPVEPVARGGLRHASILPDCQGACEYCVAR